MRPRATHGHAPRTAGVEDLKTLIPSRYPDVTFDVSEGDDPEGVYLTVTVAIDDPDEVTDLVIDRTMAFQVEEQLPVYVVPIRPISHVMEARQRRLTSSVPLSN